MPIRREQTTYVFIDESGDLGFKHIGTGSTRHFVIVALIFHDFLEVEKTALAIKELRRNLGFSDQMEFKFNKSSRKTRECLLNAINKYQFRVRSIAVDKTAVRDNSSPYRHHLFYRNAIKTLVLFPRNNLGCIKIRIDGQSDRVFRKRFLSGLRQQFHDEKYQSLLQCKIIDSKDDVLIQLADMIAGSIRRQYTKDCTDHLTYRKIIKKHIDLEEILS